MWLWCIRVWISLGLFHLGFVQLIESVGFYVSQNFGGSFQLLYSQFFFLHCIESSVFLEVQCITVRSFCTDFLRFSLSFSICFHLRCADWIVSIDFFKFTDSFVACILYWVYQWACNFSYCIPFSVLKFLFDSFDVFCFLTENFSFIYFKNVCPVFLEALKKFFLIFTLFCFTILYGFCHTLTWISHGCTWVPSPEPPSHLSLHIIFLGLFQVSLSSQSRHMWIVFSHKEISWVFECSAVLDCILDIFNVLRPWVLFESYFCFSRQLVCLGSGYKFWPAFCGSWFQYQSHFQSLVLFDFVLQKLLSGQFGTWAMVHQSWVLKNVVCCWGPDRCMCSSGVAKDLWRALWSHFAKPLTLHSLPSTF